MTRQVTRMTHPSRFRAPSIPIESTAFICAGLATRDCYLATSVDQLGDAVVHQVRSRGRKAPAKRQVEPSAARKTHAASTGLALELISGFGTKLMQEHKTARMAQEQQSLASGALLGQLQFSLSARPASGGYWIMYTNLRLETDLWAAL